MSEPTHLRQGRLQVRVARLQTAEVEQILRQAAGVVMADPRLLRRIIKQHRGVSGVVPHGRCYALGRDALLEIASASELGVNGAQLPAQVILIARPSPRELGGRDRQDAMTRMWRAVFHARVHLALQDRMVAGGLSEADVRTRIDSIGQIEFDEIRHILRHDELVMPPGDDREVYIEFAALYLELRHFAPGLLVTTFPSIVEHERIAATLALDVDAASLLADNRPKDVAPPASTRQLKGTSMPSFSAPAFGGTESKGKPVSPKKHASLLKRAAKWREKGNDVRAALLAMRAAVVDDRDMRKAAEAAAKDALEQLGERLNTALKKRDGERMPRWRSLLMMVAERAAHEGWLAYAVEARLLFELQRAAVAAERVEGVVDVASAILTLGKKKIARELPATSELRVSRHLRVASSKLRYVRIDGADRKLLARLLTIAEERAERNVRAALKPRIDKTFDQVGLLADVGPETLARDKIVEELLDAIIERGYLTFDRVRDALSRNMLKLADLKGPLELWKGDILLKADASLSLSLDGIYRRGDVYLRGLQKFSSVPFGTKIGRAVTLFLILPLGASLLLLEGIELMVNPVLSWLGLRAIAVLTWTSFLISVTLVFSLIHSAPFRAFARQALDVVALVLATIFLRVPRAVLSRPLVKRIFQRPSVRFVLRRLLLPGLIGGAVYLLSPFKAQRSWAPIAIAAGSFVLGTLIMGSRIGAWMEDFIFDQVAPTWHVLSRQWLPGLLRLITRFFSALMDLLLRGMYSVDERLRFVRGQNPLTKLFKGLVAFVWAIVAYAIRLYVTLLIEPQFNPLKYFPTVTVASKLMLPWSPAMIAAVSAWLTPLGAVIGGTFAWLTVFLLPSVFGFLAWELKENYKLYRATRPEDMPPAPVGPDGETMRALLVAGLHSGTLPKHYQRLRRAAQREDDAGVFAFRRYSNRRPGNDGLSKFRAGIYRVEQGVRRFVERELVALLHRCPRWPFGDIRIARIDLSSNRVRIELVCEALGKETAALTIEEQSGYVVAGVADAGFLPMLAQKSRLAAAVV